LVDGKGCHVRSHRRTKLISYSKSKGEKNEEGRKERRRERERREVQSDQNWCFCVMKLFFYSGATVGNYAFLSHVAKNTEGESVFRKIFLSRAFVVPPSHHTMTLFFIIHASP
jgi:fucose permease